MAVEWGQARIEAIALSGLVRARLRLGHSIRIIYDDLIAEARITMSRPRFYHYVGQIRNGNILAEPPATTPAPVAVAAPLPPSPPSPSQTIVTAQKPAPMLPAQPLLAPSSDADRLAGKMCLDQPSVDVLFGSKIPAEDQA